MLKLSSLAALSVFACTSASWASDLNPLGIGGFKDTPVYNAAGTWTGFYFGINSGYGTDAGNNATSIEPWLHEKTTFAPEGGSAGGQLGYNVQSGQFVYGIEADAEAGHIIDNVADAVGAKLSWLTTIRGRAGYLYNNALIYGTGGFAVGGVKNLFNNGIVFKNEDAQSGFVAGGGIEYQVATNWSFKAEYQYVSLGRGDLREQGGGVISNTYFNNEYNLARLGINYRINQVNDPLK